MESTHCPTAEPAALSAMLPVLLGERAPSPSPQAVARAFVRHGFRKVRHRPHRCGSRATLPASNLPIGRRQKRIARLLFHRFGRPALERLRARQGELTVAEAY